MAAIPPSAFNSETGAYAGSQSKAGRRRDYRDAVALQKVMVELAKDKALKPGERAKAAHVWVALYDARRVMAGLGLPKSVPAANDPTLEKPKRKRSQPNASLDDQPTPDAPTA